MKNLFKNIQFPLGGLDRKLAYQNQAPYTTIDALNVRPYRMESRRMSGGSRPGLSYWARNGLGDKINMLTLARGVALKWRSAMSGNTVVGNVGNLPLQKTVSDDFKGGALSSNWTVLDGCSTPCVDDNPPNGKYATPVGAVYRQIPAVDDTKRMEASMTWQQIPQRTANGRYGLLLGTSSGAVGEGIFAEVVIGETVTVEAKVNGTSAGSVEKTDTFDTLTIRLEGNGDWTISSGSEVLLSGSSASVPGDRFGFRLEAAGEGDVCALDYIQFTYYVDVDEYEGSGDEPGEIYLDNFAEYPVACADGMLFKAMLDQNDNCTGWSVITSDIDIQQEGYVMAQQRLRELFIADCGNTEGYKAAGTSGSISSGTLSDMGVSDWTVLGIEEDSDVVLVFNGATGVAEGEYIISNVSSGGIALEGYSGSDGTCSWQVSVSAKVLRNDENSLDVFMASVGSVPVNCPLICLYRDRLVMAGNPTEPHLWYMSRQGDPYDWNYTEDLESDETDYGIAVAGQNSNAGIIGEPIRALMPHSDDYLVFGYDTQLWILRGDPAAGGQLDCISRTVGVVGKRAWCYGPQGEIYFLSHNGIHKLAAGGSSMPQMVSYPRIPVELTRYTYKDNVQMSYDRGALGIHIFIEGESRGWFFSVENESFWPVEFADGADVSAMCEFGNRALFGCVDGHVRVHDDEAMSDGNNAFSSYVLIGPVRLGRDDYGNGVLQRLDVTMCGSMDAIGTSIRFVFADEPIEAAMACQDGDFDLSVKLSKPVQALIPRRSGGCMLMKVGQTAAMQGIQPRWWGMERFGAYIKPTGRFRE